MKYLIVMFNCIDALNGNMIFKNVVYCAKSLGTHYFELVTEDGESVLIDLNTSKCLTQNAKLLTASYGQETYSVLFPNGNTVKDFVKTTCEKNEYFILAGKTTKIIFNNKVIAQEDLGEIKFRETEKFLDCDLIFFEGKRKAVAIIKNGFVNYFNYYDEFNRSKSKITFMRKILTSLNHGEVIKVLSDKVERYVAYLDDDELVMKDDFVVSVFLDCVLANDIAYSKTLLGVEISDGKNLIKSFLPDFDEYTCLNKEVVLLYKKDTIAGIFKFNVVNDVIENIIEL